MNPQQIARKYTEKTIQTASPGKLVLLLFDGALRFMNQAREGFKEENFMKRNETINNNLIKAQNIVAELQSSLDMNVPGELPGTLYKLYDFVYYQLQQANLKKDTEPIGHAEKTIKDLRDAWAEMLMQTDEGKMPPPGGSFSSQA
jgi:flagellar protein FliS